MPKKQQTVPDIEGTQDSERCFRI